MSARSDSPAAVRTVSTSGVAMRLLAPDSRPRGHRARRNPIRRTLCDRTIDWSDGHVSTGIYPFERLRKLSDDGRYSNAPPSNTDGLTEWGFLENRWPTSLHRHDSPQPSFCMRGRTRRSTRSLHGRASTTRLISPRAHSSFPVASSRAAILSPSSLGIAVIPSVFPKAEKALRVAAIRENL